jgi:two-component system chemotaxis response regulator CheY
MKILSVDDSNIIRKIMRGAVDMLGFEFLEASNGQEALALLREAPNEIGLVILDWNMPVMDGYSTLVEIKNDPALKHIPVMMVTTESEKSNIIKAVKAGAQNYLTKPFIQEDLMTRIMACVGNSATP